MPVFKVYYLSDNLLVSGFLGFPRHYPISAHGLNRIISDKFATSRSLPPVECVRDCLQESASPVEITQTLPGLVYCRGGIGRVGMVRLDWVQEFANHGHIVFAPSYRGTLNNEGRDEFGGAEQQDVIQGYRLLQSISGIESQGISVLGFSRGAINAALAAAQIADVRSLILWGGVSDLASTYIERVDLRRMLKRVVGGSVWKYPVLYQQRSPIRLATDIRCRILIIHGTKDTQVHVHHAYDMFSVLRNQNHDVTLHCYEGYGHHFPSPIHEAVIDRMFDWLDRVN
jgi:dipeptidyl aminopeptidase/acylaminoacyl peptidase